MSAQDEGLEPPEDEYSRYADAAYFEYLESLEMGGGSYTPGDINGEQNEKRGNDNE